MDLELTGKTALVSGGSRGLGRASARRLALEGADVVIAARSQGPLEQAAKELAQETGRRIVPVQVETTSDESVRRMTEQAVAALRADHDVEPQPLLAAAGEGVS